MTWINTSLLAIKAHYLFFLAGVAPVVLFMPTYAKQLGFSSVLVGTIYTILPMVGMTSKPLMGAIADRFHCHKPLVIILLAITASSWFCIQFIPSASGEIKGTLTCASNIDDTAPQKHMFVQEICSPEKNPGKCAVFKLQNEHKKENNLIKCVMSCKGNEDFYEQVCNSWKFSEYCHKTPVSEKLIYESPNTNIEKMTNSTIPLNVTNDLKILKDDRSPEVSFNAFLSTQHVKNTLNNGKHCLSIPLSDVRRFNETVSVHEPSCSEIKSASCRMTCDSVLLAKFHGNVNEEDISHNFRFWAFILLMVAGWVGLASVTNLGDTICFGLIGDSTVDYGNQRLWGSVGWGFTSIFSGLLMDAFSDGEADKNYTPLFYMVLVFLVADILAVRTFKETKRSHSPSFLHDIGKLFLDIRIVVFIGWCVLAGFFNGLIGNFLFWHLEELVDCKDEAWIKTLEGLYIFIQGFGGEIPFFFINGFLLRKFGHVHCMSLVLFAFSLKFLFYSMLVNPWYVLPIGLLNGITFSTFYATMASHAAAVAAPGTEATVQGLVSALYEGVGVSMGSFFAGLLLFYFEGTTVFQLYGLLAIVMLVLHIIIQYFLSRPEDMDASANENGKGPDKSAALYTSPQISATIIDDKS